MIAGIVAGALRQGAPAVDPFFANVVALLHFDGADTSTVFTDQIGKTWSGGGSVALTTAQKKFGTASLNDPTGQANLATGSHADFDYGTGDFTVEFWARPTSLTGSAQIIYDQRTIATEARPCLYTSTGGDLRYFVSGVDVITAAGGTLVLNTWHHIAISRVSAVTYLSVHGTVVGTWADTTDYDQSGVMLGNAGDQPSNGFGFVGQYDDLRITKGVGRYTANFTPPAAAFPDM